MTDAAGLKLDKAYKEAIEREADSPDTRPRPNRKPLAASFRKIKDGRVL